MEEESLYACRFEESYDLYDLKYVQWLSIHHPVDACVCNNQQTTAGLQVVLSITAVPIQSHEEDDSTTPNGSVVHHVPTPTDNSVSNTMVLQITPL